MNKEEQLIKEGSIERKWIESVIAGLGGGPRLSLAAIIFQVEEMGIPVRNVTVTVADGKLQVIHRREENDQEALTRMLEEAREEANDLHDRYLDASRAVRAYRRTTFTLTTPQSIIDQAKKELEELSTAAIRAGAHRDEANARIERLKTRLYAVTYGGKDLSDDSA